MDNIVSLTDISVGFEPDSPPVMEGVSLHVDRGEFVVVCGISGVGKSSLLRVICGLLDPRAGTVDVSVGDGDGTARPFGFVFQEPRLYPWRRVQANVELGLEELDLDKDARRERSHEALQLVGLGELGRRFPAQLSGGQRQRVGIARALAVRPALLLMDEPFSSLDAVTRRTLQHELLGIWASTDASVLFVSHDIEEAVFLADRIVLLAGNPAHVVKEYRITDERPRSTDDAGFQSTVRAVRSDLHSFQSNSL